MAIAIVKVASYELKIVNKQTCIDIAVYSVYMAADKAIATYSKLLCIFHALLYIKQAILAMVARI